MQFLSAILALGLAASSVAAAPSERQTGHFTIRYFAGTNCEEESLIATRLYNDEGITGCQTPELDIDGVVTWSVIENTVTRPARLFERQNCEFQFPNTGRVFDLAAGQLVPCGSQPINSVDVAPF